MSLASCLNHRATRKATHASILVLALLPVRSAAWAPECTVTVNRDDIGGSCGPGSQSVFRVTQDPATGYMGAYVKNFGQHNVGNDEISSVQIENSGELPCRVFFFQGYDFTGCTWSTHVPSGCKYASSKHFGGDYGDSASSMIVVLGNPADVQCDFRGGSLDCPDGQITQDGNALPTNPYNSGQCGDQYYGNEGCHGGCNSYCDFNGYPNYDTSWICNSVSSSPPPPPVPPSLPPSPSLPPVRPPRDLTYSYCRVTLNHDDVGGTCGPGQTMSITVGPNDFKYVWDLGSSIDGVTAAIGHDSISSITIESDGALDCKLTFFESSNFGGCTWSHTLPQECNFATSKHFGGGAGDSASSLVLVYGSPSDAACDGTSRCPGYTLTGDVVNSNPYNGWACSVAWQDESCHHGCLKHCEHLAEDYGARPDTHWVCNSEGLSSPSPPFPPPHGMAAVQASWLGFLQRLSESALCGVLSAEWCTPPPPTPRRCKVTFNQHDVGGQPFAECDAGYQAVVEADVNTVAEVPDFRYTVVGDNQVTSATIETDGSADCEVTLFSNFNFEGCYWRIKLPAGCGKLVTKRFQDDIDDVASSAIIRYGTPPSRLADSNPKGTQLCSHANFYDEGTQCGECEDRCGAANLNQPAYKSATCQSWRANEEPSSLVLSLSSAVSNIKQGIQEAIDDAIPDLGDLNPF